MKNVRSIFVTVMTFVSLTSIYANNVEDIIVNTTNGPVQGEKRLIENDQGEYYAFHAIPYASPPVAELRFKPTKPITTNWINAYNASDSNGKNVKTCPQKAFGGLGQGSTDEDCLYLWVYTPRISNDTSLLPVLVWIHGGAFVIGSGAFSDNGPDRFMKGNDIIMVSINYRLGLLGFLSLGNSNVAGNMGLLDQVMALNWIKNNIKAFGGNPNMITIMGQSAGSLSVTYHMLSPLSKGLFHRVIAESGAPVSLSYHEISAEEAKR